MASYLAGLAELCVTPTLGGMMPGQFHQRWGTGVLDELFVKALVIENTVANASVNAAARVSANTAADAGRIAIVAVDCLGLRDDIHEAFQKKLAARTGIENALFAATHTHSGGPVDSWGDHLTDDKNYIGFLIDKSVDAVVLALNNMRPAVLRAGREREADISFNRRYYMKDGGLRTNPGVGNPDIVKPAGPIDPDVTVLRIDDLNGNVIGAVTNFACHLDTVGGDRICADYPGELSRQLKNIYGQNVISLFLTAPCGNINHIDVSGKLPSAGEHYKRMGRVIAGKAVAALEKAPAMPTDALKAIRADIECACRIPSRGDMEAGRALVAREKRTNAELLAAGDGSLQDLFYAKEAVRMYNNPQASARLSIFAYRIGDLAVVTAPAELFVEFSLDIKESFAPGYIMISSLSNGMVGYVVTRDALESGGYESRLCSSSKMSGDAGHMIADAAKSLLKTLF